MLQCNSRTPTRIEGFRGELIINARGNSTSFVLQERFYQMAKIFFVAWMPSGFSANAVFLL